MSRLVEVICDLRSSLGPARDQGARPTCLAFAASDAHAGVRSPWRTLSPEYVFFHAQRRAGRPLTAGATPGALFAALAAEGQPVETAWPYSAALPSNLAGWGPPTEITGLLRAYVIAGPLSWEAVIAQLTAGRPVILLLTLSASFYGPDAHGVIVPANDEAPDPALRHAVVAVGYGRVDGRPALLIRNSWGEAWGLAGHAWLYELYVTERMFGAATLNENDDVSGDRTAA